MYIYIILCFIAILRKRSYSFRKIKIIKVIMMFTKKFTSLLLLASCSFLSAAVPMVMADYTTRAPVSLANIADGQKLNCVMTDKQGNKPLSLCCRCFRSR